MPTREEMRSLAEDIVGSYADRMAGIEEIKSDVSTILREFDDSHAAMSRELKADLAKGEEERLREAKAMKQELVRGVTQRKSDVSTMIRELDDSHAAMSKELKADLAKGEEERLREAKAMKQELVRGVTQCKSDVSTMLNEFDEEQAGARDEWQTLTATMQARRGGVAVEVKPPETVAETVEEITEEKADIRDRVFEYLANHPDGTKLAKLEEEFGLARIQIAKIVKSLMDENKVEKRELFYFAI